MVGALGLFSLGAMTADQTSPSLDDTRALIEKFVETKRIISQEKRDWTVASEMLQQRIELVEGEIVSLREKIREAEASRDEVADRRAGLVRQSDALKAEGDSMLARVVEFESRVRELLPWLPDPLRERVQPIVQKLPADAESATQPLSDRFLYVIGVLNEVDKFNREITVASEIRTLPDGSSASVMTMYVGLAQAFYVGANGSAAGIGVPTANGWEWKPSNQHAVEIARAIAIFNGEQVASFVKLPVEIN